MANRDVGNTHQGMRPHDISATRFIVRKLQLHGSFFVKPTKRELSVNSINHEITVRLFLNTCSTSINLV